MKIESFDNSTLFPRKPDPPKLIKKCKIRVRSPTNRCCISVFFFFLFSFLSFLFFFFLFDLRASISRGGCDDL